MKLFLWISSSSHFNQLTTNAGYRPPVLHSSSMCASLIHSIPAISSDHLTGDLPLGHLAPILYYRYSLGDCVGPSVFVPPSNVAGFLPIRRRLRLLCAVVHWVHCRYGALHYPLSYSDFVHVLSILYILGCFQKH